MAGDDKFVRWRGVSTSLIFVVSWQLSLTARLIRAKRTGRVNVGLMMQAGLLEGYRGRVNASSREPQLATEEDAQNYAFVDFAPSSEQWTEAHEIVSQRPRLEVWGLHKEGQRDLNGVYMYVNEDADSPPMFARQHPAAGANHHSVSLFVTKKGFWCFGNPEDAQTRESICYLYSAEVPAGTLPEKSGGWTWYGNETETSALITLPEIVAATWQSTRETLKENGIIEIKDVKGQAQVNGRYAFVEDAAGENNAPMFKHETADQWLYVGYDGKWWVAPTEFKNKFESEGWIHSMAIQPGQLPSQAKGEWYVTWGKNDWRQQEISVKTCKESDCSTAVTRWEEARKKAEPRLEIWGIEKQDINGVYEAQATGATTEPPVYKHKSYLEYYLFLSKTGRWMLSGDKKAVEEREGNGLLASKDVVAAGTLPEKVDKWMVYSNDTQKMSDMTRPFLYSIAEVRERWRERQDSLPKVIKLSGVGNQLDGLWDYVAEENKNQAPSYEHREMKGRWLYLGLDNKWWVGTKENKETRNLDGWLRSSPIEPGFLPTEVESWNVFRNGEWENPEGVHFEKAE